MIDEARALQQRMVAWRGGGPASDVMVAVCDCLDAGLDGPALVSLVIGRSGFHSAKLAAALRQAGVPQHHPVPVSDCGPLVPVPPAAVELHRRVAA